MDETKPKKRGRKVGSKNKKKVSDITGNIIETIVEKPTPKKRGRKPKENIITNENPIFDNSGNTDNLIIRVKKDVNKVTNIQSFDDNDNYQEVNFDDNVCEVCWNCCHKFDNNIFGIPIKYINKIFYIYGYFCSLECGARYIFDNFNNHFEIYSLINFYYNFINDTIGEKINIAPKRLVLKMFGGNLDIHEYRSSFKTNTIFNVQIPPIYPINHNINTYDNFINTNNSKKDLKLYRKNNLPNQENNISNSMKLIM